MNNRVFCLLFFILPISLFAQNTLTFNGVISWKDLGNSRSTERTDLLFAEEIWSENGISMPLFMDQMVFSQYKSVDQYRISAQEVTSCPQNILSEAIRRQLTTDWQITTQVYPGDNQFYLVVSVLPLRLNNGNIERLTSFTLEVDVRDSTKPSNRTLSFAEHSQLSTGTWYKMAIARDGVYKIDRNLLTSLGIDASTINPQQINIYGNGGSLLPEDNSADRSDDLQKNAIYIEGESDGSFGNNDFILFYGKGPDTWTLTGSGETSYWAHNKNYYSDSAFYFIRIDDTDPLRISNYSEPGASATQTVNTFQDYQYIENDQYNIAKSGREFLGDAFEINTSATYTFSMPNLVSGTGRFDYQAAIRSIGGASNFTFNVAGTPVSTASSPVFDNTTSSVADIESGSVNFNPTGNSISVAVNFAKFNSESQGWIDYMRVNAIRNLTMAGNQLRFRDARTISAGSISEFQLGGAAAVYAIWDVSNPLQPQKINFTLGATITWKAETSDLKEFIAFTNSGYLTPTPKGAVANQDLHALNDIDLVIITAPKHASYAQQIADIHSNEGWTVAIVTPEQIYNEFSSGNPDVVAFRMLMKMLYDRAAGDENIAPKELLLFGDGTYLNNKGLLAQQGYNVMVFESNNSISPLSSYVSDDYYVCLDDNENGAASNKLDCGIGRIPASNASEAEAYVNKLKGYVAANTSPNGDAYCIGDETESSFGQWRNILTFISDDQDGDGLPFEQVHLETSDDMADSVAKYHPSYDLVKLYMDAFKQTVTPGGERYNEGAEAIKQRVQNGSLLVTYIGHGGHKGFAHERILNIPTISGWTNFNRLPVFLTATCELARFDDPSEVTAGEILINNPSGGAIAMLTTTRIVTSGANRELDEAFFAVAFEDETISDLTLGKINMLTKNGVGLSNSSKPNFSLLGDPALRMRYPEKYVYTTHINETEMTVFTDTLKALQEVVFTGFVGDADGNKLTDFNGFVYPSVYDKASYVETQNNDGGDIQNYTTFNKILYKGKATVTAGDFSFRFVVPYDINYTVDSARVSYYAVAGNVDAHGFNEDFLIGSALSGAQLNTVGPAIDLFLNDSTFVSGGITDTKPILLAQLKDENGINTVGNGIGHDLIAVLDEDTQNPIRLNDYYEADLDTYKSGTVRYQMPTIATGSHTLRLKAWDIHNNSSETTIEFVVADDAGIALEHVLNYPNPFTTHTEFFFEHNQPCEFLDVRIQVFTVGGKLVKTINQQVKQAGYRSEGIAWDGTDDYGDRIGKGVYVYKIEVMNETGQRGEAIEKLVILK
ncbi:MAG: type IX secretion system sortase PorU [Flavobacteriales bacterium]